MTAITMNRRMLAQEPEEILRRVYAKAKEAAKFDSRAMAIVIAAESVMEERGITNG